MHLLGLGNKHYELTVQINDKIEEIDTTDNEPIIQNIRDNLKIVVNKFLPIIREAEKVVLKLEYSENREEQIKQEEFLKFIINIKSRLEDIKNKSSSLNIEEIDSAIISNNNTASTLFVTEEESTVEDEFEAVPVPSNNSTNIEEKGKEEEEKDMFQAEQEEEDVIPISSNNITPLKQYTKAKLQSTNGERGIQEEEEEDVKQDISSPPSFIDMSSSSIEGIIIYNKCHFRINQFRNQK